MYSVEPIYAERLSTAILFPMERMCTEYLQKTWSSALSHSMLQEQEMAASLIPLYLLLIFIFPFTELEEDESVINWHIEITDRLGSRLYALWNRTAGDCLLDSVLQASWGVFDRDNTLRRALAESLTEGANM